MPGIITGDSCAHAGFILVSLLASILHSGVLPPSFCQSGYFHQHLLLGIPPVVGVWLAPGLALSSGTTLALFCIVPCIGPFLLSWLTQVPSFMACACLSCPVLFSGEGREEIVKVTFGELRQQVALFAAAMRKMGVKKGDRVVGKSFSPPSLFFLSSPPHLSPFSLPFSFPSFLLPSPPSLW